MSQNKDRKSNQQSSQQSQNRQSDPQSQRSQGQGNVKNSSNREPGQQNPTGGQINKERSNQSERR